MAEVFYMVFGDLPLNPTTPIAVRIPGDWYLSGPESW